MNAKKLDILFVAPGLSRSWGGITSSVLSYYKGIVASGHTLQVASVYLKKEVADIEERVLDNPDFNLFPVSFSPWRYSSGLSGWLTRHLKEYDIVHIHGMWTAVSCFAARAAVKHGVPFIISPHGMLETDALGRKKFRKAIYLNLVERQNFSEAASVHCVSENERDAVRRIFRPRRVICIPNGIDVPGPLGKDYGRLDSIAFIGRIHPKKGLDRLIQAMQLIPGLRLLVAGTGEKAYEAYIRKLIEKCGMQDRISMLGFADSTLKMHIFEHSLFTVIPSFSEGLPMTGLESAGNSTPVIVSSQSNLNEVAEHSAGLVIDNNEVESIRKGIEKMLSLNIPKMSMSARNLALKKFDIKKVSAAMIDNYHRIVSPGKRTETQ